MVDINGITTTLVSTDLARSKAFFDKLGLKLDHEEGGLYYKAGGSDLYIYPREKPPKADHTLFSLSVPDATATMKELKAKGIVGEQYPGMEQDELGISVEPQSGRKGAWITDPDKNIIGVFQI